MDDHDRSAKKAPGANCSAEPEAWARWAEQQLRLLLVASNDVIEKQRGYEDEDYVCKAQRRLAPVFIDSFGAAESGAV